MSEGYLDLGIKIGSYSTYSKFQHMLLIKWLFIGYFYIRFNINKSNVLNIGNNWQIYSIIELYQNYLRVSSVAYILN